MSQYLAALPSTIDADHERQRATSASNDSLLLDRFFAGENGALVELYDRHNQRLYLYCLKLIGSPEQAEDLTQELWERVARLRSRPQKIVNPMGFFLTIARNLCFNHLKARKRFSPLDHQTEALETARTAEQPSEMEELVVTALAEIPPDYREVLVLNLYCGYRLEEIATMLGKSPDAIRKRASRARMHLREIVMTMIEAQNTSLPGSLPDAVRQGREKRS